MPLVFGNFLVNAVKLSRLLRAIEVNGAGLGSAQSTVFVILISKFNDIGNLLG